MSVRVNYHVFLGWSKLIVDCHVFHMKLRPLAYLTYLTKFKIEIYFTSNDTKWDTYAFLRCYIFCVQYK